MFQDFSQKSLKTATIIKLAKVLFIVPIVFLFSFKYKDGDRNIKFPIFIVFFFTYILNSLYPEFKSFNLLKEIGKKGLQVSLFLIGVSLSLNNLKSIGFKPFIHGFFTWFTFYHFNNRAIKYFS